MKYFLLVLMLFMISPLFSLTLEEGNLRLVIDEENGGFLLYSRANRQGEWTSVMEDSFLGTFFAVEYNGQWNNLMLDPELRREVIDEGVSATMIFQERRFKVVITMDLIEYGETVLQNALSIKGTLTLKEGQVGSTALRFILDNRFIGQDGHFLINQKSYNGEASFKTPLPDYILNNGENSEERLYIVFHGLLTPPERVYLANWNRLDRSETPLYNISQGRSFDDLPFSVNDSAVAMYWPERSLSSGESYNFSILLSLEEPQEMISTNETVDRAQVNNPQRELRVQMVKDHLMYIQEYLDELSYIEQSGQTLSENDIYELREKLEILREKKSEYEGIQ
ncbi:MAG: hypothetical protein PF447_05425 [Spirochaetaceae bacterium]|jgi:hypothetical protein|nr:hypothetical protein [Spirochaetaceae bacterium]